VPLIVTVAPALPLRVSPGGKLPKTMAQLYGDVPPEAVHVAEYGKPTFVGPVVGRQEIVSTCALATFARHSIRPRRVQPARLDTEKRAKRWLNSLGRKNICNAL
jgi:hypothetical protein